MAKRRLAALLCAVGILMVLPSIALAATSSSGGLVSCGVNTPDTAGNFTIATQCQACNVVQLVQNIIMFLIGLSIPIAMAMFSWAGILYFTSGTRSENITKAKSIFKNSLMGFLLIITSWLIVNTILYTVLDKEQYPNSSWFHIDCSSGRIINETLGNVLANSLGIAPPIVAQAPVRITSCDPGFEVTRVSSDKEVCMSTDGKKTQKPLNVTYDKPTVSLAAGACSTYTSNRLLSCVAAVESSCDPRAPSGTDIGADGHSVSYGLWQINISAHPVECTLTSGTTVNLNCPSAFTGGAYTAKNKDTRMGTTEEQKERFADCVAAATDPKCNLEMATNILSRAGGKITDWGTAARDICR